MLPRDTINAFDDFLRSRRIVFDAVVVGGTALALLEVIDRHTRDVDVLDPDLSDDVADAARAFAVEQRQVGVALADDWLNNGPAQLRDVLPKGWPLYSGAALTLRVPGRPDLLKSKLFSLCDRGTDLLDCVALEPTDDEIDEARDWLAAQDAHPDWPEHVLRTLEDLKERLGHGLSSR